MRNIFLLCQGTWTCYFIPSVFVISKFHCAVCSLHCSGWHLMKCMLWSWQEQPLYLMANGQAAVADVGLICTVNILEGTAHFDWSASTGPCTNISPNHRELHIYRCMHVCSTECINSKNTSAQVRLLRIRHFDSCERESAADRGRVIYWLWSLRADCFSSALNNE